MVCVGNKSTSRTFGGVGHMFVKGVNIRRIRHSRQNKPVARKYYEVSRTGPFSIIK